MMASKKRKDPTDDFQQYAALTAIFFEDGDGIAGFVEEIWGVSAHGENITEARANLIEAARDFLHENSEDILQRAEPHASVTREKLVLEIA
jgi:predicted RNase H-like HicB family nuclease